MYEDAYLLPFIIGKIWKQLNSAATCKWLTILGLSVHGDLSDNWKEYRKDKHGSFLSWWMVSLSLQWVKSKGKNFWLLQVLDLSANSCKNYPAPLRSQASQAGDESSLRARFSHVWNDGTYLMGLLWRSSEIIGMKHAPQGQVQNKPRESLPKYYYCNYVYFFLFKLKVKRDHEKNGEVLCMIMEWVKCLFLNISLYNVL